jgi:hypothetical protein
MKNTLIITALLLLVGFPIRNALAFSQVSAPQNTDGTPKFTDPDEQMPGFMVGTGQSENATRGLSIGMPGVTIPSMADRDSGAQSFDQAFSHLQNQNKE